MNIRTLRSFLAVVREGSIMRAAKTLHLSQPPLSRAIAEFERQLGTTLLTRTTHGVSPTATGAYLAEEGAKLVTIMESIEDHLRDMESGFAGRIAIASIPAMAWDVLPPLLERFSAETPGAEISLNASSPAAVIDGINEGTTDVGLLAVHHMDRLPYELRRRLDIVPIGHSRTQELALALPLRLSHLPDPLDLATLGDELWIVPHPSRQVPALRELAEDVWREHNIPIPRIHEVSMMQTGLPLIAAGVGVGLVPRNPRTERETAFTLRHTTQTLRPLDHALVWSKEHSVSPVLERFVALVRDVVTA